MNGVSSASEICNILSPEDDENCINLDHFLQEKKPPPVKTTKGKVYMCIISYYICVLNYLLRSLSLGFATWDHH